MSEIVRVDDPVTETVNAWVHKLIVTVRGQIGCGSKLPSVDELVATKLKNVSIDKLGRMRVDELEEVHRRLNADLDDPILLPTPLFPYARNAKHLVVNSLVDMQMRLSQLADPSATSVSAPKRGKTDATGHCYISTTIQQRNLGSVSGAKHSAVLCMSNSQEQYLANLDMLQNGTGKKGKAFKANVNLAVTAMSRPPEDKPAEVERMMVKVLLNANERAANHAAYHQATQALREQLKCTMEEKEEGVDAALVAVPKAMITILERVASSLADRPVLLAKVVKNVPAISGTANKGEKDKLTDNKKIAAFLHSDNRHHKKMRMAIHLAIVDMPTVLDALIDAVSIDAQQLALHREAYHNKQHPQHTKVYARIEEAVAHHRIKHGVPAPKLKNLVGEVVEEDAESAGERGADVQTLHAERTKAAAQISLLYPDFGAYATAARREARARALKKQEEAETKKEAARKTADKAKLARQRECTKYLLLKANLATQAIEAARRAKEVDATSEWL